MERIISGMRKEYEYGHLSRAAMASELNRQCLKPERPSGTDRIYFRDPNGFEMQLSSADHWQGVEGELCR
jgi:hypothetical protein